MSATPEETMAHIHQMTADRLILEIENPKCDPRYIQMAIKFLNDNSMKMVPEVGNELGELDKHLQNKKKRFGNPPETGPGSITDIATKQAIAMGED